jgi:hypothetical protein
VVRWKVRKWTFRDGGEVEARPSSWGRCEQHTVRRRPGGAEVVEADRERNRDRAGRRARGVVRRLVRAYLMRVMLTLTFPGDGVQDFDEASRLVRAWLRTHGRSMLGHYVVVWELHPGGHGWHAHILCDRFVPVAAARLTWTQHLARRGLRPSGGSQWVRVNVKDWGSAAAAVRYAAKYVTKGCQVPDGRHRYSAGGGAEEPAAVVGFAGPGVGREVLEELHELGLPRTAWVMVSDEKPNWEGAPLVLGRW